MRILLGIPTATGGIDFRLANTLTQFYQDHFINWIEGLPRDQQPPFYVEFTHVIAAKEHTERAHTTLLKKAIYDYRADWLVICGADQWAARIDEFTRMVTMCAEGERHKAAIIGAPVALSRGGGGYNIQKERNKLFGVDLTSEDSVFAVDRIGSGFTAYSCNWFRAKWPTPNEQQWWLSPFTLDPETGEFSSWGLDYRICDLVKAKGGKIFCDRRVAISHERTYDQADEFGLYRFDDYNGTLSLTKEYRDRFTRTSHALKENESHEPTETEFFESQNN
jgi:hypothetical protein